MVGGRLTDQPLDDGRGGVRRDRRDIAHGGRACCGDRLLGRREPLVELGLEPLIASPAASAACFSRVALAMPWARRAGVGERLLVGGVARRPTAP